MSEKNRFDTWKYPEIEELKPTKYNWVVQNKDGLELGYKTDTEYYIQWEDYAAGYDGILSFYYDGSKYYGVASLDFS